jgi:hypothetical protein
VLKQNEYINVKMKQIISKLVQTGTFMLIVNKIKQKINSQLIKQFLLLLLLLLLIMKIISRYNFS